MREEILQLMNLNPWLSLLTVLFLVASLIGVLKTMIAKDLLRTFALLVWLGLVGLAYEFIGISFLATWIDTNTDNELIYFFGVIILYSLTTSIYYFQNRYDSKEDSDGNTVKAKPKTQEKAKAVEIETVEAIEVDDQGREVNQGSRGR